MHIKIKEHFIDDYTSREAGEKLRQLILHNPKPIEIDFSELKIASASFFDEGLAKLAQEGWDSKMFNASLRLIGLFTLDAKLLIQTCHHRGIDVSPSVLA